MFISNGTPPKHMEKYAALTHGEVRSHGIKTGNRSYSVSRLLNSGSKGAKGGRLSRSGAIALFTIVLLWSIMSLRFRKSLYDDKEIKNEFSKETKRNWRDKFSRDWSMHTLPHVHSAADGKCHSLKEISFFYPPVSDLPPPSSALIRALRDQEERQIRCVNQVRDWKRYFYGTEEELEDCKYIIWLEDNNGIGNHLLSLISAFTYALLTKRALLVDNSKYMDKLLCDPFPNTSWWIPQGSPLLELSKADHQTKFLDSRVEGIHLNAATVRLGVFYGHNESQAHFFCDHAQKELQNHAVWLGFISTFYVVPGFFLVSSFQPSLKQLFPHNLVAPYIARYLLHPANHVWDQITRMYIRYYSSSNVKIGVQIRTMNSYDSNVSQRVFDCLCNSGVLPSFITKEEHDSFIEGKSSLDDEQLEKRMLFRNATRYSLVVTSLHLDYFEFLKTRFDRHPTSYESSINVYFASHEVKEVHNLEKDQTTIAEIWLLSMSDILFHSWHSTFGNVARALGAQKRAYMMNICDVPTWDPLDMWKTNHQPVCDNQVSSPEACFHLAPHNLLCPESKVAWNFSDPKASHPSIQICKDVQKGIALVPK